MKKHFHLVALTLFCLTPLVWFVGRPGVLIDGVDTNFPLNPVVWWLRRLFAWNDIPNAGAPNSSNIAGIFFHTIQAVPYFLGANIQLVEIISLVFWFTLVVFSGFAFIRLAVPKNKLSQIVFVCLYAFNIYLFNTWENIKVSNLALAIGIPLFLSILLAYEQGKLAIGRLILYSALASVVVCGAGINPAYFMVIVLAIGVWVLINLVKLRSDNQFKPYLYASLTVLTVLFLINSFWIIPTLQYLLFSQTALTSLSSIGFSDWVNSLSEHTSLLNVFRLQGAWDWYSIDSKTGVPLYIPYSVNYFTKLPFLVFSFLLPALAIGAFLVARDKDKRFYLMFGVFLIIGLVLGAGTHPPTGLLFSYLGNHMPFFSFLRSPWYIFTPLTMFAIAGLISFLTSSEHKPNLLTDQTYKYVMLLASLMIILGNLVYAYPLVLGRVFRPGRPDGFYINFPPYVFKAEVWLKNLHKSDQGRVVSYPSDNIEQFDWGYRAPESILELFSPFELLFNPLNDTNSPIALSISEFYRVLGFGEGQATSNIADKLNISLLFDKEDQSSLMHYLPPQITSLPQAVFEKWHFYILNPHPNKIFTASDLIETATPQTDASLLGLLKSGEVLVDGHDSEVSQISDNPNIIGQAVTSHNSQMDDLQDFEDHFNLSYKLKDRDLSKVSFSFTISVAGSYQPILERFKLESYGLDPTKGIDATFDQHPLILQPEAVTDSFVYFAPLNLDTGDHVISFKLQSENLITDGGLSKFKQEGYGNYQISQSDTGEILTATNLSNRDTSASYSVAEFDPKIPYLVQLQYHQIYGNLAQLTLFQYNNTTPFKDENESFPDYPGWKTASVYYTPVNSPSELEVRLDAPFTKDPLGTIIQYSNLKVEKVFTNNLYLLNTSNLQPLLQSRVVYHQKSPIQYTGEVHSGGGANVLVFLENYSPDWEITFADRNNKSIELHPLHFSADSYANAWYIPNPPGIYKFKIIHSGQKILNTGFVISALTLASSLALYICYKMRIRIKK